ncbi:hypothetical protein KPH14_012718 [Odynerus spinipes]|uniref:Uncharacterized protein n=1 Tax=Odynerus spinipes TaxID=1348599 RepID=A0AAD9VKE6_9HYME|nr:hypothetical protein KPH14_012718 [Odynerus spinipes]
MSRNIAALNKVAEKYAVLPFKKLQDIPANEELVVNQIKKMNTRYGLRVAISINNEYIVFPPNRVQNHLMDQKNECVPRELEQCIEQGTPRFIKKKGAEEREDQKTVSVEFKVITECKYASSLHKY